ncbi:NUDIX hydrolase [bacterium]|nr:NUDIX hydrolase [bacterium]
MDQPDIRIGVVIIKESKILLIRSNYSNHWFLPGGNLKHGESIIEIAQRKVWEETNLKVSLQRVLMINESISSDKHRHTINIYFLGEILQEEPKIKREKLIQDCKFLTLEEIEKIEIYPNIKKEIKEMIQNEIYVQARYRGNIFEKTCRNKRDDYR